MASAKAKIRHVFGDTFSCRAAPPDILVKLSDHGTFKAHSTFISYMLLYVLSVDYCRSGLFQIRQSTSCPQANCILTNNKYFNGPPRFKYF